MLKQGSKKKSQDACIPLQVFHMVLSYVSGPSNLEDMISNNAPSEKTLQQSRDGYIGFLRIIDVKTYNLSTHPVKNKDPPLDYIESFLQKHGIWNLNPSITMRTVKTTKDGNIAQSCAFDNTDWEAKYNVHSKDCNFIDHLMPNHVDAYIQTNGGGKFPSSHAFWCMVTGHNYDITSTAPDASHQNGIVERPHQSLKEGTWLMLYAARLGVEFWADALLHATWL